MDTILEVLKWVVLILIAGFIGQFGKSLSTHIIDYFRRRKNIPAESDVKGADRFSALSDRESPGKESQPLPKAEKKTLKAQLKAQKKAPKV